MMSPSNEPMRVEQNVPPPYRFYDGLAINEQGCSFLGTSSRTGRYWNGSLLYLSELNNPIQDKNVKFGVELSTGLCDLQYIADNRISIGLDDGAVAIWQLDEASGFKCTSSSLNHDDMISSISVNCDKSKIVSGSYDRRVIVWDLNEELNMDLNVCGHSDIVQQVNFHPSDPHLFVSCGQDGTAILWDLRKSKPAHLIDISNLKCLPTCIEWKLDGKSVVIGSESGNILTQSIDSPKIGEASKIHKRSINKMIFHPKNDDEVFSISNDCSVLCTNLAQESPEMIYKNEDHTDFVKDIAWDNTHNIFCTVGWDTKIIKHYKD